MREDVRQGGVDVVQHSSSQCRDVGVKRRMGGCLAADMIASLHAKEAMVRRTRGAQARRHGAVLGVSRRHAGPGFTSETGVAGTRRHPATRPWGDS